MSEENKDNTEEIQDEQQVLGMKFPLNQKEYDQNIKECVEGVHIHSDYANDEKFLEHVKNMQENPIDLDNIKDILEPELIKKYKEMFTVGSEPVSDWQVNPYDQWSESDYLLYRSIEQRTSNIWSRLEDLWRDSMFSCSSEEDRAILSAMKAMENIRDRASNIILGYIRYIDKEKKGK